MSIIKLKGEMRYINEQVVADYLDGLVDVNGELKAKLEATKNMCEVWKNSVRNSIVNKAELLAFTVIENFADEGIELAEKFFGEYVNQGS